MFQLNVLGFQTHRDRFSVAIERDDIVNRVRDMRDVELSTELLRERVFTEGQPGLELA